MKAKIRASLPMILSCLVIPAVAVSGAVIFRESRAAVIISCICAAVLACIPFVIHFERSNVGAGYPVIIAVMTAMSVAGRVIFAPVPSFKPVTAIVVVTAMYFGPDAGFMTGALSAVISNFFFGQGPWTPFQMFSWGILGLIAGLTARLLRRSRIYLVFFAVFSGILYSLSMDVFTVLWADGCFNITRYIAAVASAVPVTVTYAVSNVIFLMALTAPIGKMLERVARKYGLDTVK